ncbi:restriction endonuclease subunit S [Cytobacillus purgationiresistens]|uniref:Type I restriction enzyme S subunit n=1 Tax=Cytobacillus purgationiresistens TaxID=863449 RepID=A0ABU0AR25_9BACI|nr:restriction endonuclease subunit S [Cytobacillus purgationiresistens]MDQ0273733.1 type I restriction enzyme S subunit [Cytobacillus purgationiresistens]
MESKRIPEIRFLGFSADWDERILGDLLIDVSRPLKMVDDDVYQLVTVKRRNGGIVSRGFFKGSEVLVKSQFIIKSGDYLISKRQVVHGANGIVPDYLDGSIVSNEYLVLHGTKELSIDFFSLISELPSMYKIFFLSSYGIDIEKLVFNVSDWKKRKVFVPSISEQLKITSFLQVINNAITLHQQELTILKQTKQGFLQKMFPKEGESVPEVRFPGFIGNWEQRKFSEIATIRRGLTYKPSDVSGNGVRVLRSSNINEDTFELKSDDVFVKKDAVKIEPVKENDILITSANGSSRLVGKHAVINGIKTNMVHGGFMLLASSSQPYFVNALMNSSWYKKFINVYVSGGNGAIGNLSKGDLESQIVYAPGVAEQVKIGNFFKQLDETIALHQRELEALKETKKAFLQKIFV